MSSCSPNYLPKAPSPNTITLWVMGSTYGFGEDTIQCTALGFSVLGICDVWCLGWGIGLLMPVSHSVLKQNLEVWTGVPPSEQLQGDARSQQRKSFISY